jgi:outer membrane protein TolC
MTAIALLAMTASANISCAWGETAAPLTWQDCVRLASRNNPDLISALRAMEASRAQYSGSYNGILPQLNLSNSYSDSATSGFAETKRWQAQATASLNLIDFGQWASIQSASASLRQSEANRQLASSNVLLALYRSFAGLLYSQEQIGVAAHIRDLWSNNAQLVNLRYQSGRESKGNNMRTEAESLQARLALDQAGRDLRVTQQELAQALGQDDFSALVVTGTWTTASLPATPPDLGALIDHLPSVRAQQAAVDVAKASIRSAQSTLFPSLSLNYNKGLVGSSEFPSNPYWAFSGTVNYPLFGGGPTATYYASTAAQRTYEKAQQDLLSQRHQSRTNLESAWSALAEAQDQVKVQRAFLEAAAQRKGESDIRYQSGLMSFQDWQVIMNDYVNSERGYLSAEQSVILAEAQWRFASGQQLGDSL